MKLSNPAKMISEDICVVIANYDFSDNADILKQQFSKFFHTILIDSDSPKPPQFIDIKIKNTYYPGLWNAAVEYTLAKNFKWLMFVASDLIILNVDLLCSLASEAITCQNIGVYSPSLTAGSRCIFLNSFNKPTSSIRECGILEGFFFLAQVDILKDIHPISDANKSGWGVDFLTCYHAYLKNKIVVIDDRVEIFHPNKLPQHNINDDLALFEMHKYIGPVVSDWSCDIQESLKGHFKLINIASSLDLGCGQNIRNPYQSIYSYGVDLFQNGNQHIKMADLSIEPIPFGESEFEYVTSFNFIEYIPRLIYCPHRRYPFVELMNEVHRVLKPGGIFLSVARAFPDPKAFEDPTHVNIITEDTFKYYFCSGNLNAGLYGFTGEFHLVQQRWNDGMLISHLRAIK